MSERATNLPEFWHGEYAPADVMATAGHYVAENWSERVRIGLEMSGAGAYLFRCRASDGAEWHVIVDWRHPRPKFGNCIDVREGETVGMAMLRGDEERERRFAELSA